MSAFHSDTNRMDRKAVEGSGTVRERYITPLAVSILLILYFILCGYIALHGATVLSSLESSENTTFYGP